MVDIHTHLLFNTDDGVENIEKAIEYIKTAKQVGFDTICVTPHYVEPEYNKTKIQNRRKLDKIKMELKKRNIDVKLYLGNEIYISEKINKNLKNDIITTIAKSDYVLIELPRITHIKNLKEIFDDIINSGKKIIIAHPERYIYVQENIKYFDQYIQHGNVYLQGNYSSIIGTYGINVQKTIMKLIKEKKLHILATDIHNNNLYEKMPEIINILKGSIDKKYIEQLIEENPRKIIENEKIDIRHKNNLNFKMLQIFNK